MADCTFANESRRKRSDQEMLQAEEINPKKVKHDTKSDTQNDIINSIFHDSESELTPTQDLSPFSTEQNSEQNSKQNSSQSSPVQRTSEIEKKRKPRSNPAVAIAALQNPFQKMKPDLNEESLLNDLKTIRQQSKIGESAKPILLPRTRSAGVSRQSPPKRDFDNHDNCSACLGIGNLLCCDTCPRVFHHSCVQEGFGGEKEPDESWQCRRCVANSEPPSKPAPHIFGELLHLSKFLNPRAFELPKSIRDQYEHIFTHPISGAYMDDREVEIIPVEAVTRITRKTLEKKLNSGIPTRTSEIKPVLHTCFRCSRTDLKILQTSFLNSNTVPKMNQEIMQAQRSELIRCDHCFLYWHLDCLDPPLSRIPPELQLNEIPVLDIKAHNFLKLKLWNNSSPLDPELKEGLSIPFKSEYKSSDMHLFENCHPDLLESQRFMKIKKKWMCPCHADWETPKQPNRLKWDAESPSTQRSPTKRKRPIFKVVYNDPKLPESSSKNNGWITIKNDQKTEQYFASPKIGIKHQIPESRLQLEFMSKINRKAPIEAQAKISLSAQIQEKLEDFSRRYHSNINELYKSKQETPDFKPLVEKMIESESIPRDLQEVIFDLYSMPQPWY